MTKRESENLDNVIYAHFGRKITVNSMAETMDAGSESGAPCARELTQPSLSKEKLSAHSVVAVSDFIVSMMAEITDVGRFHRGEEYYENDRVLNVRIGQAHIDAQVSGSQPDPFDVRLIFSYRSTDELAALSQRLAEQPYSISEIRRGQLQLENIQTLLVSEPEDIRVMCSCPDPAQVCKHAVAVAMRYADMVRSNPAQLFALRGLNLADIEQSMLAAAQDNSQYNGVNSRESFWQGHLLPELPELKRAPAIEDSNLLLLHRAMRLASYTTVDELRAVADIEDMYDYLTNPESY
ncbi:hypothetical protein UL82_07555 [Corynebacterium kutscheri]|uniref:SWIM-type domain-containing protein n=1 Tax=Corynebacterium kutscheri TaxID=35755 RepID=A0A0F6R0D2_9CORY|nr:hypothetical protein [Corynebacterium kutscheri]AKE41672.1 hypothetical protein UL82_07555 [Corynebacterium kutscheri]VEH09999.1 Uncharacterized conserved protein [Corynebacterium kutscheri]